jgi:two-component system, cell cycle sensor histidine kinase and response regulator CckA
MGDPYNSKSEGYQGLVTADLETDLAKTLGNRDEHFRILMDLLPICFMAIRGGLIIYANPGLLRLLGYEKAKELVGRPFLSLFPPEEHAKIQSRLRNITEREKVHNPVMELSVIGKNGEKILVEGESTAVMHQGVPTIMGILRDITARKKAEESLRLSEENFKTMIGKMPEGVLVVDDEKIVYANAAMMRMLGCASEKEILGRPKFTFFHPDFHAVVRERIGRVFGKGGVNPLLKMKLLVQGGETIEVESSSISVLFDGKPAVLGVLRDMTEQNQMERHSALNDKLATVGTLAAGIAHEINNPLTYVLANLIFLAENFHELKAQTEQKGAADERSAKLFKEIGEELNDTTRGGERIRDIVGGLKSFVRSNEDEVVEVDLNQTVESAVSLTLYEMKQKAVVMRDFAPNLPTVAVNPGKLLQVFINLLINAAQAIECGHPEQNQILIRTGRGEGRLFVEITDTGKGIPEKIQARIFDTFFTTKPIGVGTGLGLSICQEIVRRYQGTLKVQSPLGKGATFTVTLPVKSTVHTGERDSPPPTVPERGRILVLDDEPANLEIFNKLLKKNNEVLSALTGLDALGILEREKGRVDSIVSDINMPDMNGVAFYKNVAQQFPGLEKRIVFVTGGLFQPETIDFLKTVPNRCLAKPFDYKELLGILSPWTGFSQGVKGAPSIG